MSQAMDEAPSTAVNSQASTTWSLRCAGHPHVDPGGYHGPASRCCVAFDHSLVSWFLEDPSITPFFVSTAEKMLSLLFDCLESDFPPRFITTNNRRLLSVQQFCSPTCYDPDFSMIFLERLLAEYGVRQTSLSLEIETSARRIFKRERL